MKLLPFITLLLLIPFIHPISMDRNAMKLYRCLMKKFWKIRSISAILGIAQAESGLSPALENPEGKGSYGLLQWSHESNITSRANYETIETQCELLSEGFNYSATSEYNLTITEFSWSKKTPESLVDIFYFNFRGDKNSNSFAKQFAGKWFNKLEKIDDRRAEYHIVKKNEHLDLIARNYNMELPDILELNPDLNINSTIHPGDKIRIAL